MEPDNLNTDEHAPTNESHQRSSIGLTDLYKAAFTEVSAEEPSEYVYQLDPIEFAAKSEKHENIYPYEQTSVLDLDKGVPISLNSIGNENVSYTTCDSQILQRYLQDSISTVHGEGEPSVQQPGVETLSHPLTLANEKTGVFPEKLGVKYEDCDFHSSDSFASTESIIPKTIQCPQCPKSFMFKSDLTRHKKRKHIQKTRTVCSVCNKEFPSFQNLLFHERSHQTLPDLVCSVCKVDFTSPSQFAKHMEDMHENETPFECLYCPKTFRRSADLMTHRRKVHKVLEVKYQHVTSDLLCPTCGKVFFKKQNLDIHMSKHKKEPLHICVTCGQKYQTAKSLRSHISKHHKEKLKNSSGFDKAGDGSLSSGANKCNICPMDSNKNEADCNHVVDWQFVTFSCPKCNSSFYNKEKLIEHTAACSSEKRRKRKHSCLECEKVFRTKKAMLQHVAEDHKPSTQEMCTQTEYDLQTVNLMIDSEHNIMASTSLPVASFSFSSVPLVLTQQSSAVPVPYSTS